MLEVQTVLTDSGDSGDDFAEFELVQDGCLTGSVKTDLYREFR